MPKGIYVRNKRISDCHPERPHLAKGLCQQCYYEKYQAENREQIKAANAKYHIEHLEQDRVRAAKRYAENTERAKERGKKYRAEHPEKEKARQVKRLAEHLEQERARKAKWRTENPEKMKAASARWKRDHPEQANAQTHKRRARKAHSGGSWTAAEWAALKNQYNNCCLACKKTEEELLILGRTLAPDHVQSLADGETNTIDNLQPLCHGPGGCNNKKGVKHVDHRGLFAVEYELSRTVLVPVPMEEVQL